MLVVDDEPLIRWSICETLRQEGYTVVEAGDARTALSAVGTAPRPFDVVVLDVRLPDSDGLSFLSALRQAISAPIVVITAHGTSDLAHEARVRGAFSVMHKPFEMQALAETVDEACGDGGVRCQRRA